MADNQTWYASQLESATWLLPYVEDLADIADALRIPKEMRQSQLALAELYRNIDEGFNYRGPVPFFEDILWPFLSTYKWQHHEQSVADTLHDVAVLQQNIKDGVAKSDIGSIKSLAECVFHFYQKEVAREGTRLFLLIGQPMCWFPGTEAHRKAFALTVLLHMLSQTQINPPFVSRLYSDALKHLSSFRCEACRGDLPQSGAACEVCPTLEEGEIEEFPWGTYLPPSPERKEELLRMLTPVLWEAGTEMESQ
ncbi:hypothetical protein HD806DRAFT_534942 [Xylariaceae sp. AK1471]|nr:hypothetical protein HD806DRAFT_534942 [Xylariaceae sp. AK1471]